MQNVVWQLNCSSWPIPSHSLWESDARARMYIYILTAEVVLCSALVQIPSSPLHTSLHYPQAPRLAYIYQPPDEELSACSAVGVSPWFASSSSPITTIVWPTEWYITTRGGVCGFCGGRLPYFVMDAR